MHLKTQGLVCGFKKTQGKKNQQNGNGVKVVFHSASNIHLYNPHLTKFTQRSPAFGGQHNNLMQSKSLIKNLHASPRKGVCF